MLIGGWYQAASTLAHEERILTEEVAADGVTALEIDNEAGSVHVVGVEDATAVTIRAHVSDGWRSSQHERAARRAARLVLRASCPNFGSEFCLVNYTIEVPADLAVEVRGNEGVEVSDLTGPVYAESDASGVVAARISGDLDDQDRQRQGRGHRGHVGAGRGAGDKGGVRLSFDGPPRSVRATSTTAASRSCCPRSTAVLRQRGRPRSRARSPSRSTSRPTATAPSRPTRSRAAPRSATGSDRASSRTGVGSPPPRRRRAAPMTLRAGFPTVEP